MVKWGNQMNVGINHQWIAVPNEILDRMWQEIFKNKVVEDLA